MQRSSSVARRNAANRRMRAGVLALGATILFAGEAVMSGQQKPATTKAVPAKPAVVTPPRVPVKTPQQVPQQNPQPPRLPNSQVQPKVPNNPYQPKLPNNALQPRVPGNPLQPKVTNNPLQPKVPVNVRTPNLPVGRTPTPKGFVDVRKDGTKVEYANNRPVAMQKPGLFAKYGQSGHPTVVRAEGPAGAVQVLHRGPGGIRLAEGIHPAQGGGQLRVASTGPKSGFQERPVFGRPGFIRRSGIDGDRHYAQVYRSYSYNKVQYYRPVPTVVYSPAYYGWAAQTWSAPVVIQVGFQSQPWYSSFGTTFTAYQQYSSADQWMTDQILAQNMQRAYDAGRSAGAQTAGADVPLAPPAISPELKQQFDAQVKQEVQEQGQRAAGGAAAVDPPPATANEPDQLPDALKPGHTVFRVVATLDVESDGDDCTLNTDDWIVRNGGMSADGTVPVTVAASRSSDCAQGSTTRIALNDLMTMQNEEDQQIQSALKMASLTMGKGGMPAGPPAGAVPVPGGQAQPDLDVVANLEKEQADANAAERQAAVAASPGGQ